MAYFSVNTSEANFRIILERHDIPPNREEVRGNWDGVFEEWIFGYSETPPEKRAEAITDVAQNFLNGDLIPVYPSVKEGKTSLFFGDLSYNPRFDRDSINRREKGIVGGIGMMAAASWLRKIGKNLGEKDRMSRRDFLKKSSAIGILGVSGWLLSSFYNLWLCDLIVPAQKGDLGREITTKVVKEAVATTSHFHPEETEIFLRNLVMAEKLEFLGKMLHGEKERPVSILSVFGAAHAGIGDMIKWGEGIRHFILSLYAPFLPDIFQEPRQLRELCRLTEVGMIGNRLGVRRDVLLPALVTLLDPEGKILGKEGQIKVQGIATPERM